MRRGTRKPHGLKVRHYTDNLIDLNEYLDLLTGANITDKMVMTEFNEMFWNSMPNIRSKQAYVQGFDCKYITFKNYVNIF